MKHNPIKAKALSVCNKIDLKIKKNTPFFIKNFHPSILYFLIKGSKNKFIFYFSNGSLDAFSYLFDEYLCSGKMASLSFVDKNDVPEGFVSENLQRNISTFSSIYDRAPFKIIIAEKGVEKKLFKKNQSKNASFLASSNSDRDTLVSWLKKNNYVKSDFVYRHGEYSVRGGVVDVFSYSLRNPARINFFDKTPSISLFYKDTQISYKKISSYLLASADQGSSEVLFSNVVKENYISFYIDNNRAFFKNNSAVDFVSFDFNFYSYSSFLKNKEKSIIVDEDIKNYAIEHNNSFLIPRSFSSFKNTKLPNELSVGDYSVGDFFVHKKFGIGCFCGLKTSLDGTTEQLVLNYKNNEFVNISVENMDSVSFYSHSYEKNVELDSLSGKGSWARKISSVKKEASRVVDSILLSINERASIYRAPYSASKIEVDNFVSKFSFNETPDQKCVWGQIYNDLASEKPMNRLLCGDVGFGKTEIAMRASFVVSSEAQVAILAPTTILSLQLYYSFKKRFEFYAQNIEFLNRLKKTKEKNEIYTRLTSGVIDIIIGTHALLSKHVKFKNLGLVIIDEEHRFGVKQKEKINNLSKSLDLLSMSATPIPRSLQHSFSGLKNLSLMKTPPVSRKPIITKVLYSSKNVFNKYIKNEIKRRGQVYIVYNNVDNIYSYTKKISNLFPNLVINFIHGQLPSNKIESRLSRFINKKIDVLVCSSIIEAGIDVPNTNTILIENSHLYGLAQLYQLRGRVGRSFEQAFAILLVPKNFSLSHISKNRLKTIEKNNALGSNFTVAKKDLSMRGSGSIFGYSQSGSFSYVGRELYSQLIKEAVMDNLSSSSFLINIDSVVVSIYDNLIIESSFISNQYLRFEIYKKIFSSVSITSVDQIKKEILNRFGVVSDGLLCLFNTQKIRILCALLGINNIVLNSEFILNISFSNKIINVDRFLSLSSDFFSSKNIEFNFSNFKINKLVLKLFLNKKIDVFCFLNKYLNTLLN